jgi:hypothetical protein
MAGDAVRCAPNWPASVLKCDLYVFFYLRVAWLVVTSALPEVCGVKPEPNSAFPVPAYERPFVL